METTIKQPRALMGAIRYFSDPDRCLAFAVKLRWPDGVTCPTCSSKEVSFLTSRRIWKCSVNHERRQFSVKVGTIFGDSPIGLDKWFATMWMIANCKNGVSSYEIHRAIQVTQKSAWFMVHRIRLAMQSNSILKLEEEIEADESFIGGLARNMHKWKRAQKISGTGGL
jgi:transposase-like protein